MECMYYTELFRDLFLGCEVWIFRGLYILSVKWLHSNGDVRSLSCLSMCDPGHDISRLFEGLCQGVKTLYCLGLSVLGVTSVSCLGGSVFSPRCVVSVLSVDLYPQYDISGGVSLHSVKSLSCFSVFITRYEF